MEYIVPSSPERYAQSHSHRQGEGDAARGSAAGVPASVARPARGPEPWAAFSVGSTGAIGGTRAQDRYQLESARSLLGDLDTRLWCEGHPVIRYEGANGLPAPVESGVLGVLEPHWGTRPEQERALLETWSQIPRRVTLLLPFVQGASFWALAKGERAGTFLQWNEDVATGRPGVMARILRKLYRVHPKDPGGWEYLAYLEMLPTDVAHVREELERLRDARKNPLWGMVDRAAELWMVRQPSASVATRWPVVGPVASRSI